METAKLCIIIIMLMKIFYVEFLFLSFYRKIPEITFTIYTDIHIHIEGGLKIL